MASEDLPIGPDTLALIEKPRVGLVRAAVAGHEQGDVVTGPQRRLHGVKFQAWRHDRNL